MAAATPHGNEPTRSAALAVRVTESDEPLIRSSSQRPIWSSVITVSSVVTSTTGTPTIRLMATNVFHPNLNRLIASDTTRPIVSG